MLWQKVTRRQKFMYDWKILKGAEIREKSNKNQWNYFSK